jgi:hypothetical protein
MSPKCPQQKTLALFLQVPEERWWSSEKGEKTDGIETKFLM